MRILYDHQAFSRQFYGGVSRYMVELIRHIAVLNNVSVTVLAPLYINNYLGELDSKIVRGRKIESAPRAAGRIFNIYNRIVENHWLKHNTTHILHETYYSAKPASRSQHTKTVLTVHDMIHEKFPDSFSKWDYTARRKRMAVERSDHVICVSENTKNDLLDMIDINPDDISVIHHGFQPAPTEPVQNKSLIDGQYILYVGNRGGYKNFSRLLNAYASNRHICENFKLVCFGGGNFNNSELHLNKRPYLGRDKVIWMTGNDDVLSRLYSHASAFVYPSLYEGFGMPLLEAMNHNCPVICSQEGSFSEVIRNAGEYFNPYSEQDISCAMERVLSSDTLTKRLRDLGKERIAEFSWDKCASETLKLYARLTEQTK